MDTVVLSEFAIRSAKGREDLRRVGSVGRYLERMAQIFPRLWSL